MSYILPGIHENLKFSSETSINEKGTLKLVIEKAMSAADKRRALENDEIVDNAKSGYLVFTPQLTDFTGAKRGSTEIMKDLTEIKKKFIALGSLLGPAEEVNSVIGGLKMLDVFPENQWDSLFDKFNEEPVLEAVMKNLTNKFYTFLINHPNFEKTRFRHKFHRQKPTANYSSIPWTLSNLLLVEPMTIPKEQSKLGWAEWEIKGGKNDASEPVPDNVPVVNPEEDIIFAAPTPVEPAPSSIPEVPSSNAQDENNLFASN